MLPLASLDPRGPIIQPGKPPIVGHQSVQIGEPSQPVRPDAKGPGMGKWIWGADTSTSSVVRFRKLIQIEGQPKQVIGWMSADTSYRLWINGHLASRGPADVGRDYDSDACGPWFDDRRDLTRYFKTGSNVVAVEAFARPLVSSEGTLGKPGFKMDLTVQNGSSTKTEGTDPSWRTSPAPDLDQKDAKNGFRLNMALEPAGWQEEEFNEKTWADSIIAPGDRAETLISELAPPLEAVIPHVDFTRVSEGVIPDPKTGGARFSHNGEYTLRYGHILSGYVGLKVKGHAGARLLIMPNEYDSPGCNRQAEVVLREGVQTLELPYFDSFSVINIKAEGAGRPFEIQDVRCVFTSYPVQYRGEFTCSNPEFNRIWEISRWVTQICMQTHHLDSPHHQEPISDAGDYLIESLNEFYAFGEGTLARQDLKKIARNLVQRKFQSFHTSYSLLWLKMLLQYYDYTGDRQPIDELAPEINGLLDQFETYIGPNGIISQAPNYMFMDWVTIGGFEAHHPPAVVGQGYMTALYYQALGDGSRVATLLGDTKRAEHYQSLRTRVGAAFDRELWVPEKGLYRDGKPFQTTVPPNQWLPADKNIETFSTQVNTLAVTCGLAPKSRAKEVMQTVLAEKDMNCQPYFMHFVFDALDAAGIFGTTAPKQLQRWKIIPDSQSFHEMWEVGDLSHAWNASPLYQMSGRILGVTPLSPGFAKFEIHPDPCGLTWAKGQVPTPHGPINVYWNLAFQKLDFSVPAGTTAEVEGQDFGPGTHHLTLRDAH